MGLRSSPRRWIACSLPCRNCCAVCTWQSMRPGMAMVSGACRVSSLRRRPPRIFQPGDGVSGDGDGAVFDDGFGFVEADHMATGDEQIDCLGSWSVLLVAWYASSSRLMSRRVAGGGSVRAAGHAGSGVHGSRKGFFTEPEGDGRSRLGFQWDL